jgi:transglutaminase-like putative cysteine protease
MKLQLTTSDLKEYLKEVPPIIQFHTPLVRKKIKTIETKAATKKEKAQLAFEIARDEIQHSFDIQSSVISISAEETLAHQEGICFAKAHLLAALLRGMEIPTGFCYQRVLRKGTVASGYALHGLNAIYLEEVGWFRVDPRGNKQGVHSEFSITTEKLAYPIREKLGEVDYPNVFTTPLSTVIAAMRESENCQALFHNRPEMM